jgi:hypothetical protein
MQGKHHAMEPDRIVVTCEAHYTLVHTCLGTAVAMVRLSGMLQSQPAKRGLQARV